jgi:acyl-CoA thioester hydrolase
MSRQKVMFAHKLPFRTTLSVRVSDLNYGGHLGNDAILGMIQEARIQLLNQFTYTETNLDGVSLIMTDVHINYLGEAFLGDNLEFRLGTSDVKDRSFDMLIEIHRLADAKIIAKARTSFTAFDYTKHSKSRFSEAVQKKLINLK